MSKLVVILSSFNRAHLLKAALASLDRSLAPSNAALVIFDAGSQDGSAALVREFQRSSGIPTELLTRPEVNVPFSAGVNFAVEHAFRLHADCEFLLLFETDNYIEDGQPIAEAVNLLRDHPEIAAAGFTVRKHNGAPAGFGCPFPRMRDFILGPQLCHAFRTDRPKLLWQRSGQTQWSPCAVVYTSPMVIRRDAWAATGGFSAQEFPFADCDLDWAWRLREHGFIQAVIQTDAVVHDNQQQTSAWSSHRAVILHRARYCLLKKHSGTILRLARPALFLRHCCELLASLLLAGRQTYRRQLATRFWLMTRVWSGYR